MVSKSYMRCVVLLLAILLAGGCSKYQPVKNVWKSTKGLWNTYVSPPAHVDYDDKGGLPPEAIALSSSMLGVDKELTRLERTMQNADKPPTQQWLDNLFATFPWLSGFAGVKYDGTILGQQPENSLKELDFNPLLYEDKKQNSRALRADVQPSPMGPEIMLATPLYDGVDFLGIVVAYFDMRALIKYSSQPQDIVAICPGGLLWPGKYDFAATPLAGVDWSKVVAESSSGSCSNERGTFYYQVRYIGNLPVVFAIAGKGDFPEGNGDIGQGFAYFPTTREKMAPPPAPERKPEREHSVPAFVPGEETAEPEGMAPPVEAAQAPEQPRRGDGANEIQPGSRDSVLLHGGGRGKGREVQERALEGENVPVERVQRQRRPARQMPIPIELLPEPEPVQPMPEMQRPSPFGPRDQQQQPEQQYQRPSPFGPGHQPGQETAPEDTAAEPMADGETPPPPATPSETGAAAPADGQPAQTESATPSAAEKATEPAASGDNQTESREEPKQPATLPGGRPSPFGPR